MKRSLTPVVCFTALLLLSVPAMAHKVMVFAWVEAGEVHTESKFSGGKKVMGGKIEVFDHNEQLLVQGETDGQGRFSFPQPREARSLNIVMTAGMGHTSHWTVTAAELGVASGSADTALPPTTLAPPAGEVIRVDAKTLAAIVERSLEKKLAPLKAQLTQQSWGLRDIVAGIGYILGLMGLASYLRYRPKKPGMDS